MKATHITVRTREGTPLFRRAGFVFTRTPTEIAIGDLAPGQLEAITGDSQLEVAEVVQATTRSTAVPPPPADDDGGDPKRRNSRR